MQKIHSAPNTALHHCISAEAQLLRQVGVDYARDNLPSSLLRELQGIATRLDAVLAVAELLPTTEGAAHG